MLSSMSWVQVVSSSKVQVWSLEGCITNSNAFLVCVSPQKTAPRDDLCNQGLMHPNGWCSRALVHPFVTLCWWVPSCLPYDVCWRTIKEFPLHMFPTVGWLVFQVYVLVECSVKWADELLHEVIAINASNIARLDEVSDVLVWIAFFIELQEFRRMEPNRHSEIIKLLRVWLGVHEWISRKTSILCFDSVGDHVLELLDSKRWFLRHMVLAT